MSLDIPVFLIHDNQARLGAMLQRQGAIETL